MWDCLFYLASSFLYKRLRCALFLVAVLLWSGNESGRCIHSRIHWNCSFSVLDRKKYTHHIIGPPTSFCTFQLFVDRVESSPDEPYLGIYNFTLQSAASRCRAGSSLPLWTYIPIHYLANVLGQPWWCHDGELTTHPPTSCREKHNT